jgi:hypothetical protein
VPAAPAPPPPPAPPPSDDPPTTVYAGPPARDPHIGVGVRASALRIGRSGPDAAGIGALLRFRARPVELELEVGRDEYRGDVSRSDTRLGATLYVPLVSGRWVPFLLVGTGVNFSYSSVTGAETHQGFVDGGAGLALQANNHLVLDLDGRYLLRQTFEGGAGDQAVELRLTGMVYF